MYTKHLILRRMWRIVKIIMKICYGLCQAVLCGMEMLFFFISFWRNRLETPLLASLRTNQSNDFIINLVQKGYNINKANKLGETPLHIAASRSSMIQVVHELIKSGANINAQDRSKRTPLRHAIQHDNVEAVCILLYYDADVNIVCRQLMAPFTYAVYSFASNIASILIDYYDEFSCQDCDGVTSVHLAEAHNRGIAIRLLNRGADVTSVTACAQSLLEYSLRNSDNAMFKHILSKMDHRVLLLRSCPYLLKYINDCDFTTASWLEGMYLLLGSYVAEKLVQSCNNWMGCEDISDYTFFQRLARIFDKRKIESKDRISIIYVSLSLGAQANISDLFAMYAKHGFNEEVEALIDMTTVTNCFGEPFPLEPEENISMPVFILALEKDLTASAIYKWLMNEIISYSANDFDENNFKLFLGFFFMSSKLKKQIMKLSQTELLTPKFLKIRHTMLSRLPEVPTLLELSRNRARALIKRGCNIHKPWQFHRVVRNLNVPHIIKEIIRFKRPIY